MLQRSIVSAAALSVLLAASAAAQMPKYLDVFTVKIKPERYGDFMAGAKRIADANRRFGGDHFLAWSTEYGEQGISFTSRRDDLAAIERAMDMFHKATGQAFGATAEKVMHDLIGTTSQARSEIRVLRWDITRHAPEQQADLDRIVGNAHWMRTITLRVKPERRQDFENWMEESKSVMEKADPQPSLVSQSYLGQEALEYYVSQPAASLADLEKRKSLKDALGEQAYNDYVKRMGSDVHVARITLARALPELSNIPESIASVSRDFWTPKTTTPTTAARKARK